MVKKKNKIHNPKRNTVVTHGGWDQESKNYPCDVYIVSGSYLSNNKVSNYWIWRRILKDGTLGHEEHGYGDFFKSKNNYKIDIIVKKIES